MLTELDLNTIFMTHADACRKLGNLNPNTAHSILRRLGVKPVLVAGRHHWYTADIEKLLSRTDFQEQVNRLIFYKTSLAPQVSA